MNIEYIKNVSTLEELKKEYRNLAMKHHPDVGGSDEVMKMINNEYDFLFSKLKNTHKNKDGEFYESTAQNQETSSYWIDLINKLLSLNMQDVAIEVIGSFLWVSGNTKPYKNNLGKNGIGLFWSNNKSAWYKSPPGYKKHSSKDFELDDIRDMYGSQKVNKVQNERLTICG